MTTQKVNLESLINPIISLIQGSIENENYSISGEMGLGSISYINVEGFKIPYFGGFSVHLFGRNYPLEVSPVKKKVLDDKILVSKQTDERIEFERLKAKFESVA